MIYTNSGNYIQYGFWRCAQGCSPMLPTGGETREFWEWSDGGSYARDDGGTVANGLYSMKLTHITIGTNYFEMRMNGTLRAQVFDDGWRHWSLVGAIGAFSTETLDIGDQLGGTAANDLRIIKARWSQGWASYADLSVPGGCLTENIPAGVAWQYGCSRETTNVDHDGLHSWTNDR